MPKGKPSGEDAIPIFLQYDRSMSRQRRKSDYVHDGATSAGRTRARPRDYMRKRSERRRGLVDIVLFKTGDDGFCRCFFCCFFSPHSHKSATFLIRQTPWISTEYHQRPKDRDPVESRVEQGKTANDSMRFYFRREGSVLDFIRSFLFCSLTVTTGKVSKKLHRGKARID